MPEDGYSHVPMDGGPGVYVADPEWLAEVCARNARLDRPDVHSARSTEDGEPA